MSAFSRVGFFDQVRRQLRRLYPRKVAGPDRVCPRMLKACAAQLGEPLQHVFNQSLRLGRVPATWKTTCLIPVPKKAHPKELNDYRPVALTSHVMKTMERLLLNHLGPQVHHAEDPLQFAYREKVGVEDAILYLLHRAHSHLDKGGCAVRVMFFDFSSAFNTIQPLLLRDKLMKMEVDMHLVTWITDYLTGRPQHVRIRDCSSDTVISSTGAPQGTVLSPVLFTLYTSDFKHNSELCHMQKFSDDTAVVGCVRNGQEREYRSLVEDFVEWCTTNHLKLNITKTKEMCIDFRRSRPSQQPISIKGVDVEVVRSYRYLGVHLDERLDWSVNTDTVYKKAQSRLYFRICQKLLLMFYQSVVASVLFYAVVCWGGSISKMESWTTRQAGQESWFCAGTRAGVLNTTGREESPQQAAAHHGQCSPSSAHHDHQAEELIQWQTAVPVLLHRQTQEGKVAVRPETTVHHIQLDNAMDVIHTDESRFYLSTCDRRDRLWRRHGECYAACNIIQHDWFGGGSVMVWGGISLEGRTDLYRIDTGTLTAIRYQDGILGPVVGPYAGAVGPGFLLVHNNARPHVARACRQFLEKELIPLTGPPARLT
ncbi:hypothetical protein NFI96_005091 [Prochilodus magdalenae]|nr:hypothetical protein NFI96_005091 [Prochilodus magdalenae]